MTTADSTLAAAEYTDNIARRVAIQLESVEPTMRAHVFVGYTLDGPTRLAALMPNLADLAASVAEAPKTTPRGDILNLIGHLQAWLETSDREAAR